MSALPMAVRAVLALVLAGCCAAGEGVSWEGHQRASEPARPAGLIGFVALSAVVLVGVVAFMLGRRSGAGSARRLTPEERLREEYRSLGYQEIDDGGKHV
eukprot:TRINITY_DN19663_c0_g2_i1.p3 TRINITY_DN19663_c0_g2~~TRINITY_DN19663_c0_g2_i1.p3  ORF type:complete len:100 (+),score=25.26 TRINITY_DN19663_c0_g2_i1:71-370(+)